MNLWDHEYEETYRLEGASEKHPTFSSYETLSKEISHCTYCPLRKEGGRGPVLSTGPKESPLMIVGEGPGRVEDEYGGPLVGPSGQLLDKALASVGITRDHVYVTNIVKCRPRGNRTPTPAEGTRCGDIWLREEIRLLAPKVIIGLGKVALRFFLGREAGILRNRGHWLSYEGIPVMPTYHPAYLLRLAGQDLNLAKWHVYYDLKAAKEKAAALSPTWNWASETPPNLLHELTATRAARMKGARP